MSSPFGTIVSRNITPDKRFGIGNYSYAGFARTIHEGVAPDGKRLYPAMPYVAFSKIADDDMRALYAYMMQGVRARREGTAADACALPLQPALGARAV